MTEMPSQRDSVEVMESQFRDALNKIAHDARFNEEELAEAVKFIARTAAEVLNCERASIWEYLDSPEEGKCIHCLTQYNQATGQSTSGGQFTESTAGSYVNALDVDTALVINDVSTDPRCLELNKTYLPSNNIRSMLDAPYQFNGKLAGVLRLEHVGLPRVWSTAEQHFCTNMASLITIASERQYRRNTELKLREEEDRYRSLVEDLAHGLVIIVDEKVVFANKAAADITKIDGPEILTGMRLSQIFPDTPPGALKEWEEEVRQKSRDRNTNEYHFTLWDNSRATLEVTASAVNWYGSSATQAVIRDVTEASYAQKRLKRSERLLSQAQKIARLGSWVWDLQTDQTECSQELRSLLGLKGGNPLDAPIVSLAHPDDTERLKAAQTEAIRTKQNYEITYRVITGSGLLWLEEIGVPELGPEQKVIRFHGTSRDITRQKSAELEAQVTEERFSALGNSFPGGFVYCDLSTRFLFINETFAEWFDIDPADYLGKTLASLIGQSAYQDLEHHLDTVKAGQSVTFEAAPLFRKEGIEKIQSMIAPDKSVDGEIRGIFGLFTDITELRGVELALRHAQKMEAMGQLTGGIAHDFNNILAILMGNLELAQHTSNDPETQEYLAAALQGVERGVSITQKLLGFARSKTRGDEVVQLDQVITGMKDMITQSIGARVTVTMSHGNDLWPTRLDSGDLEDAIINLCINARDAMPDGGQLLIKTENKTVDEATRRIYPSLQTGDYVLISVTDTGIGMDTKNRERLFEPFFTTKPEGKGTGLGMSMVFGFVKRSGGEILVYSAPGEGTTINIYLPRSARDNTSSEQVEAIDSEPVHRESILIVDDEEMVANVAAGILKELGYSTRVVTSSRDALKLVSDQQPFDLLFSDVVMPGDLNGFELAKAVHSVQPRLKILLTSGFSKFRGIEPEGEASGYLAENILGKPYNRIELATSVRKILDSANEYAG